MSCRCTSSTSLAAGAIALALLAFGCSEVRGRKLVQEGNDLYKKGRYGDAVAVFTEAEQLVPTLPELWLNKGYTCRQLIAPGAQDPQSKQAVACALAAFKRLAELRPSDARADSLTIQTMFDANDLSGLEAIFLERNRRAPDDVDVVRGLQQVYYKWGKWPQALNWSKRAAALRPADPEAQYGVGTFIWQVLSSKGGGPEMAAYDPRPRLAPPPEEGEIAPLPLSVKGGVKNKKAPPPPPVPVAPPAPALGPMDITGTLRIELADEGIKYLQRALTLRPKHPDAMTYLGLLWRQRSFASFGDVPKWQADVDQSNEWQKRAALARTGKS
jgi:tetratricopeptide (TPR) repeat protein